MLPLPFPASTITLDYGDTDTPYSAWSPHQGIDFSSRSKGVVAGAVIHASGDGVVHRSGWETGEQTPTMDRPNKNAGNSIDVDYLAAGVRVRYMHRPADTPSPAAGDTVTEGTGLGVIGDTGYVTAAHLHMETWQLATGRRVSPWLYFTRDQTAGTDARPFEPKEWDEMATEKQIEDAAYRGAQRALADRVAGKYSLIPLADDGNIYLVNNDNQKRVRVESPYHVQLIMRRLSNDADDVMLSAENDIVGRYLTAVA